MKIEISDEEIQAAIDRFELLGWCVNDSDDMIGEMRQIIDAALRVRKARKKARKQVMALSS